MDLQRLIQSLQHHADHNDADIALSWPGNAISYSELWSLSHSLAAKLPQDISLGSLVLVEGQKTPYFIALMIALGMRRLTPLVVPARLGAEVRGKIIARAGVRHIISLQTGGDLICTPINHGSSTPDRHKTPLCLTTSGSTGIPKVVLLTDDGVGAFFDWAQSYFDIGPRTRLISIAPLNFDLSLLELWAGLDVGAEIILADPERSTQPGYLAALCEEAKPEIVQAIPLFHDRLCAGLSQTSSFRPRHLIVTGEASTRNLRMIMAEQFPDATFHNIYGSTETNDSFILSLAGPAFAAPVKLGIGWPIAATTYKIDADPATSDTGELLTATPFAASGYSDAEQTVKAFISELENGRLVTYFRTGDRVRMSDDGSLELIGRADLVVKLRGVRTNLLDVEDVIRLQPSVLDVATIPYLDPGNGQQQLLAVIVTDPKHPVSNLEMRAHCALHLPASGLPSRYVMTQIPLPKTSTGKVNRGALQRQYTPKAEMST